MMPHLTLDYSDNIHSRLAFDGLFDGLHRSLSQTTGVAIGHFKSRARCYEIFRIGDGSPGYAFVHLDIRLLDATGDVKQRAGDAALDVLRGHVSPQLDDFSWQLTVDLGDLDAITYRKATGGTCS